MCEKSHALPTSLDQVCTKTCIFCQVERYALEHYTKICLCIKQFKSNPRFSRILLVGRLGHLSTRMTIFTLLSYQRNHHLTLLIVMVMSTLLILYLQSGLNIIMAISHQHYWIIHGRSTIKQTF